MNLDYQITPEEYDLIYKKYINDDPKELLELAGMQEGHRVLDLCSGASGRLTKVAVEMGAEYVAAVDLNPMILHVKGKQWSHAKVEAYCEDVYGYLEYVHVPKSERFDVVVCQQGLSYWFNRDVLVKIYGHMKAEKSVFVFDVCNKKPNENPTVAEYEIDGRNYVEATWMIDDEIHSIHIVDGTTPRYRKCKWVEPETILETCKNSHFDVQTINKGDKDIYICTRSK